ncbi:Uncharacterised protein [Corynebacterium kutscheri]|uniref:Transposase n=1 Tax=Corynebacterium kutscheri TaxID=35755 RepID=A0A0F6R1N6_9CORY|nr:hypothetical protein UL82_09175 [Corynebacterium kutscheri]VEH06242.1 Uncharacterised protein [Corynebacterium kutscheri]VEH10316.1 Uncharacterised protein [Corynebacterium kutscheri]VEH82158.1 Uncharacterised protein [Corynebacterium kutscheri]
MDTKIFSLQKRRLRERRLTDKDSVVNHFFGVLVECRASW